MDGTESRWTRRELLQTAGVAATAAVGGLTGCLGSIPGIDGGNGRPPYARWLPGRDAFGVDGETSYQFVTTDTAALRNNEAAFSAETYESLTDSMGGNDSVLPGIDAIDLVANVGVQGAGSAVAFEGSFSAGEVTGGLGDDGFEEETDYAGYAVYTNGRGGAVGVRDGVLVGRFSPDPREAGTVEPLSAVIDAGEGDADRLPDEDDDADALVSNLGAGLFANGVLPARGMAPALSSDALAANGLRGRVDGATTNVRQVLVYDDAGAVDAAAVENASGTAGQLDDPEVTTAGRTALVDGSIPTEDVTPRDVTALRLGRDPTGPGAGPVASFDFEYDADAGVVRITHQAGDEFTADNTGELRYGIQGEDLRTWPLPVAAGDQVTLDGGFDSGDRVVVVWESPDGGRTRALATFRVP